MEISPKALREVEFREKLRGYHPEDVDEFVERVASGIEALQERLRLTTERAVHAEQLVAETGTQDDAIKRTLILAQRTADMAIEEAQEQARTIIDEAQSQAGSIVSTAREEADALARQAQEQLRADLDRLSTAREQLLDDVRSLEAWLGEHRSSLSAALFDALQRLEAGLASTPAPGPSEVDVPPLPPPIEAASLAGAPAVTTTEADADDADSPADTGGTADGIADDGGDDTGEIAAMSDALIEQIESPPVEVAAVEVAAVEPAEDDAQPNDAIDEDAESGGDAGKLAIDDEDDPFMAELRRAVDDDEPLGPRDDDEPLSAPPGHERVFEDGPEGHRFGGRRRRRR